MASSDEDVMEEPDPDYFRQRRRSNTLPSDILRNLRDKHKVKDAKSEPSELTTKLRQYLSVQDTSQTKTRNTEYSPDTPTSSGSTNQNGATNNGRVKKLATSKLQSLDNCDGRKGDFGSLQKLPGGARTADKYIDTLMRASSLEALQVRRSPLPRGSNLYESLLSEFGQDEEEKDTVSPLPSPEVRRKFKHRHTTHHMTSPLTNDVSTLEGNAPRRVHWSQDIKPKKFNKR